MLGTFANVAAIIVGGLIGTLLKNGLSPKISDTVLKGLALCYSYYGGNGLNDLPAGAFMARKGFYYGWMTPDGQWLYCRSIFASSTDEHGYGDLI